jgi:hypothetical protein
MAIVAAKLIAEIGADTTKLETGLKKADDSLKKTGTGMGNIGTAAKGMGLMIGGAATAAMALDAAFDQTMEFGKAGAQLVYASEKFDRLSASIGTTGDELMGDLRTATRGLLSDAELVQSAGDMMALGLAKSREEAVRLSTVSSALGMDMNQLVLTLTNQTTMRFDALGVSVDGFGAKVEHLKETGMDANAAFKEAFLQQAEEQMRKVGNQADSTAGAFKRLEAAQKNLSDQNMKDFAPALGFVADGLVAVNQATIDSGTSWMRYLPVLNGVQAAYAGLKAFFDAPTGEDVYNEIMAKANYRLIESYNSLTPVQKRAFDDMDGGTKELANSTRELTGRYHALNEAQRNAFNDLNYDPEAMKTALENQKGLVNDLEGAYANLASAQQNWSSNAGAQVTGLLNEQALTTEEYLAALGAADEQFGTHTRLAEEQKRAMEAANKQYENTGDLEAYKTKLGEIKETYLPLDEAVKSSTALVETFSEQWNGLESKFLTLHLNYEGPSLGTLTGNSTSAGSGGSSVGAQEKIYGTDLNGNGIIGRASGGPGSKGKWYLTGEKGPELIQFPQNGYVYTAQQTADMMNSFREMAAGQSQQPGGPVIIHKGAITISGAGKPDVVADLVIQKLRRRN